LIRTLLRQTDLGDLLSLVSPSLFDVVSVPGVLRRGRQVLKESKTTWPQRREHTSAGLPASVRLVRRLDGLDPDRRPDPQSVGDAILTVYFTQLLWDRPTVLDLRASAWGAAPGGMQWAPAPTTVVWDPAFIDAMRGVYRGFYEGDNELFEDSLARLSLRGAADLFRAHFGGGDQRSVAFDRRTFVQSFGAIFEHCKQSGVTLHEDFVLLGAYLAGLYDSLSDLGVELDVRAAYDTARAHVIAS